MLLEQRHGRHAYSLEGDEMHARIRPSTRSRLQWGSRCYRFLVIAGSIWIIANLNPNMMDTPVHLGH
jgi:hypothetical protein